MNPLLELADRVEAAKAGDTFLDAAIWLHQPGQDGHAWKHGGDRMKHAKQIHGCQFIPAYTTSLDAAQTLVPEGSLWATGTDVEGSFARLCIVTGIGYIGGEQKAIFAATPALALTAASLRAIASMGSSGQ